MIVIDEFAQMAGELPDFVTGLVGIAAQGASLGIHLILATQRPSGVVSADIRANTNLRIALRVTDQADSTDVIDAPDAAHIAKATPGRAYVRLGHASLVPFQAGDLGGSRPQADAEARSLVWAARVGWTDLGRAEPHPHAVKKREEEELTDLKVLPDAIKRASEGLDIPPQHSPWLPPLSKLVTIDELHSAGEPTAGDAPLVPFGVTDIPTRQTRELMVLDIAHGGHVVIAGAPRSGRSTVLRTIAGSVAAHASPADVHIYALDCGASTLLPLTSLPHCGAVVTRDQTERVERLLARLRGEITRRQQLLAAGGFAGDRRTARADRRSRRSGCPGWFGPAALVGRVQRRLREIRLRPAHPWIPAATGRGWRSGPVRGRDDRPAGAYRPHRNRLRAPDAVPAAHRPGGFRLSRGSASARCPAISLRAGS